MSNLTTGTFEFASQRFDRHVTELLEAIEVAFGDVAADFPEAESGWENDVARSVARDVAQTPAIAAEALRILGIES